MRIKRPRGLRQLACATLLMAVAACGSETPDPQPAQPAAVPVVTAPAGEYVLPRRGTAPAEVRSANESDLSADVTARVESVVAEVGSTVRQGETLMRLDDRDYRLALEQADARASAAQARLALATQRLARARTLLEGRYVSQDEMQTLQAGRDAAAAELRVARADRAVAARNVAKTRITAPFDGVVVERFAQVGTLAPAGSPLLRMVQTEGIEVEASVQASEAAGLADATQLRFQNAGRNYPMRLLRLASVVERGARTQVARLAFVDEPAPAGSAGTLVWQAPGQRLPPDLMVSRGGSNGFFVVEQGRARFRPAADARTGRAFDVDIDPDTLLVVDGQQALTDGDLVQLGSESQGASPDGNPGTASPAGEAEAASRARPDEPRTTGSEEAGN
ncbi:MAG: efflux RND transporter periplasmic adaptor subunit [Pseudomonadota bacterium]|nr:efflux RND transporter periplasmic adaptor subunit [Pseudomonadota bacterium]